ncbi:MAG: DUF2235 domain-containing protein [Nitrospira sp.]|nr:DUF2235 domain-containing protein [Nitrospira sp.]MDH4371466.1 DUF2235 domain-containing protein [Nitrospira sp.]MDH5347673.1 DUF2235 domain-containing protein [Nitrospira sp.]MDH5498362.1 DUF2235 domain-containing protein [Nitrospira sp.]MDH5725873.1 DUF2235 domain-containing protein [Nitrospira sp.]
MSGKNIVLCSDGTGNTAIKARGTNVFKLYEAVDIQGYKFDPSLTPQVAFYDDGVGTSRLAPMKLIGGAFGYGFGKNVRDLYTELVHVYEPGDHIYLFGFSRGAYTVRALSGLIQYCGIVDIKQVGYEALRKCVRNCWTSFRREAFKRVSENERREGQPTADYSREDRERRKRFCAVIDETHVPDGAITIDFVGVWDTVGAVGMPFEELRELFNWIYPMRFSELTPSSRISRACHALSIDDDRRTFHPELWNEKDIRATQVEQVWFAGVHSNVGGGYVKHGMSLVALDWMMAEAERCGLRFIAADRNYVRTHHDVHDELYDARGGLGVYYRWEPRDIVKLCRDHNIARPKIHISVFERIANGTGCYAPVNLPAQCVVVRTNDGCSWPEKPIMSGVEQEVAQPEGGHALPLRNRSLLESIRGTVQSGKMSYYTFVAATIPVLGWWYSLPPFPQVTSAITQWCPYPNFVIGALYAGVGLLVWRWSKRVDNRMESVAQNHWQRHREALRNIFTSSYKNDQGNRLKRVY